MPTRMIREGWLESERIHRLDAAAERFFLRLCLRADDFGRYHANPVLLKSNLFPLHEEIRSTEIPKWLRACEEVGLVHIYMSDGKKFLEIPRFGQRMRAAVSRFPSPDVHTPDIRQADDGHMPDIRRPESEGEGEGEAESTNPSAAPDAAAPIYDAYPRKQGRKDAVKAIHAALKACPADRLLERTLAYAAAVGQWPQVDRQYVPHPSTWFNRGSYDDDPATWVRNGADELPFNPEAEARARAF